MAQLALDFPPPRLPGPGVRPRRCQHCGNETTTWVRRTTRDGQTLWLGCEPCARRRR